MGINDTIATSLPDVPKYASSAETPCAGRRAQAAFAPVDYTVGIKLSFFIWFIALAY
jgi:hypothetical protein